jgi:hypothetical protein
VQRLALGLLPHCAALDPRQHRNPATILANCQLLHGDRLAAAEVMNRLDAFRRVEGPQHVALLQGVFAHQTEIDWAGDRYSGPGYRANAFWAGKLEQPADRGTSFGVSRVIGESAHRVRVAGEMSRAADTPQGAAMGSETASVEQIWVRDVNGEMALERATIGPWVLSRQD